jgi:16S rRNA (guanine966-N2)-methyltransferase
MTRIVSGEARGRRLQVPHSGTRPTSDRVREALFSTLEHRLPEGWSQVVVLDAFAGSGALGLEAWSRGAGDVLLIEKNHRALEVIRRNIESVGARQVQVFRADTWRLPPRAEVSVAAKPFDLVFLDPPYNDADIAVAALLGRLERSDWLAPDCVAVVERSAHGKPWQWPKSWEAMTDRRYSDTQIHLGVLVASRTSTPNGRG